MNRAARLRREQVTSGIVNFVLSGAFFFGVFGFGKSSLHFAAPDNFALDFLPQSAAIASMSSLVPLLVVSGRTSPEKRGERTGPRTGAATGPGTAAFIVRTVLSVVVAGIVGAGLAAAFCFLGPGREIGWSLALAVKLVYGTVLGISGTTFALNRLFAHHGRETA